jgi:hypothetical protein
MLLRGKSIRRACRIEQKEDIRWLENLKQSTVLLNDPDRCVHIGAG